MAHFKGIWAEDFLRGIFNDAYVICVLIFFIKAYIVGTHLNYLDKFIKSYVVGTHLNFLDLLRQFSWVPLNICYYKEVDTDCNLQPMKLLDCALIEVCA